MRVELVKAQTFARMYVDLTEALRREGVLEETARSEARTAALAWLKEADQFKAHSGAPCPLCGRQ